MSEPSTEPPVWKRLCDAPPPNGFYWTRYTADEPLEWCTIIEVEGDMIRYLGTDVVGSWHNDYVDKTTREYYIQPLSPPQ